MKFYEFAWAKFFYNMEHFKILFFNFSKTDLIASKHTQPQGEIEMSSFENSPLPTRTTLGEHISTPPSQHCIMELPRGRSGSVRTPRSPVVRPRFMSGATTLPRRTQHFE